MKQSFNQGDKHGDGNSGREGQITLPKKYREKLGIKPKTAILIDITSDGILVKPATVIENRVFSDGYINELTNSDQISTKEKSAFAEKWK